MGGKCSSCSDSRATALRIKKARLIGPQGNVVLVPLPITAADLMLQNPGYLVASADGLLSNVKVVAVGADACLSEKKLYLLISADEDGPTFTEEQLGQIHRIRSGKKRRCGGGVQVSPVGRSGGTQVLPDGASQSVIIRRTQGGRRWTPVLQTIPEVDDC